MPAAPVLNAGISLSHGSKRCGQRGWNGQPGGTRMSDGGAPSIGTRRSPFWSTRGRDSSRPHAYGCKGSVKTASLEPSSMARPAYMTITVCATSAITPRSCVMRTTPMSNSRLMRSMSSRICAWTVTSSAVVGSSAMRMSGLRNEGHRDHRALAHAARKLVRIILEPLRGRGMPTAPAAPPRGRAPCAWRGLHGPELPRRFGRRRGTSGADTRMGPGRSSPGPCRARTATRPPRASGGRGP